ncbi:type II toxin-antitoxin system PemK/MazF family toxin [Hydrogenimonas sp.]
MVDFGRRYQSNIGKVRPAVVLASQSYLEIVHELRFPSVLVFPLTTQCTGNPENLLRVPVAPRDRLEKPSEIIVNWSCSVDVSNIDDEKGPLTSLRPDELKMLEEKYALYCGLTLKEM